MRSIQSISSKSDPSRTTFQSIGLILFCIGVFLLCIPSEQEIMRLLKDKFMESYKEEFMHSYKDEFMSKYKEEVYQRFPTSTLRHCKEVKAAKQTKKKKSGWTLDSAQNVVEMPIQSVVYNNATLVREDFLIQLSALDAEFQDLLFKLGNSLFSHPSATHSEPVSTGLLVFGTKSPPPGHALVHAIRLNPWSFFDEGTSTCWVFDSLCVHSRIAVWIIPDVPATFYQTFNFAEAAAPQGDRVYVFPNADWPASVALWDGTFVPVIVTMEDAPEAVYPRIQSTDRERCSDSKQRQDLYTDHLARYFTESSFLHEVEGLPEGSLWLIVSLPAVTRTKESLASAIRTTMKQMFYYDMSQLKCRPFISDSHRLPFRASSFLAMDPFPTEV